ncbi:MAG: hypothetical protein V1821_01240 [bacterium]
MDNHGGGDEFFANDFSDNSKLAKAQSDSKAANALAQNRESFGQSA